MKITVWSKLEEVDETVRANIERRLRYRFNRFSPRVLRVNVRITDLNGPRGGVDKISRINIRLRPTGNVFVQDVDQDAFVASDRASERAARSISRAIKRVQRFERDPAAAKERSTSTSSNSKLAFAEKDNTDSVKGPR